MTRKEAIDYLCKLSDGATMPNLQAALALGMKALEKEDEENGQMERVCQAALDKWGAELQTVVALEEMSELHKELCKYLRGRRDNVDHIAEEIADVQIVLEQMILLHDCRGEVEKWMAWKLARLERRIGGDHEAD